MVRFHNCDHWVFCLSLFHAKADTRNPLCIAVSGLWTYHSGIVRTVVVGKMVGTIVPTRTVLNLPSCYRNVFSTKENKTVNRNRSQRLYAHQFFTTMNYFE